MPIWYIIGVQENVPPFGYGVWRLFEVHATTMQEVIGGKFDAHLGELRIQHDYRLQTMMVAREIENPFQAQAAH